MDMRLDGRSCLVLGSTSGLGLAIAKGLSAEGANVVVTGRRESSVTDAVAAVPRSVGLVADLSDPAACQRLGREAQRAFGQIDVLVLNSGGPPPGTAADLTPHDMDASLRSMLLPQIALATLLLPQMRTHGWGRVLAIGSSGVQQPIANLARSNAARAALAAYLKTLANEVSGQGVTVNMLLPGRIDTRRVADLDEARARRDEIEIEAVRRASAATIPIGRYGRTDEFADVAVFLCSDRASYVTGAQIRVDGGAISAL
ncbi:MAG: 3-oxoacyl-ACP reductase [Marmoricola sp.]|jgi:3-oxoacyl-[acyl-carrier protein] reductase|nr:3-oxoacyl-ACP reductase [Marmoricola sp.]